MWTSGTIPSEEMEKALKGFPHTEQDQFMLEQMEKTLKGMPPKERDQFMFEHMGKALKGRPLGKHSKYILDQIENALKGLPLKKQDKYIQKLFEVQTNDRDRESTKMIIPYMQFKVAPYFETYTKATQACDRRRTVDLLWDAFQEATEWGGQWSPGRIHMLYILGPMMDTSPPVENDLRRALQIFRDESEPSIVRVIAANAVLIANKGQMTREEILEMLRSAMILEPTPKEKERYEFLCPASAPTASSVVAIFEMVQSFCRSFYSITASDLPKDLMHLKELKNRPELNCRLVKVVKHDVISGKCAVRLVTTTKLGDDTSKLFAVKAENLERILRPAA